MAAGALMARRRGYQVLAEKYAAEEKLYIVSARGAERERDKGGSEAAIRTWDHRAERLSGEREEPHG